MKTPLNYIEPTGFSVGINSMAIDISTELASQLPSVKKLPAILMKDCGSEITTFMK